MLKRIDSFTAGRKVWVSVVFIFAILALLVDICGWQMPQQNILFYNVTASLPRGIYLCIPATKIERGDIIVYDPPKEVIDFSFQRGYVQHTDARFLKRVGAIAGDMYSIGEQGSFCINGVYIGEVRKLDSQNRPLPQLEQGDYVVPDGAFLPIADTTHSFDGRYTGTVSLGQIRAVVIPVLTRW